MSRPRILTQAPPTAPAVVPLPSTAMMFGPMDLPQSPPPSRRLAAGARLLFMLATTALCAAQDARPDQVFRMRRGDVTKVVGTVTENSLETVRLDRKGKEASYGADEVVRIVWGAIPPSYQDGLTYLSRDDHENAVARFRIAATDASSREVVQADARLRAVEALITWGASDGNRYTEAVGEAQRFLTDHPSNREVPRAQWLKGRAQLLAGDAAGAATTFKALYEQGASDPPASGYDRALCLEAGLAAAKAYRVAMDAGAALALYPVLEGSFRELAQATEDDPRRLSRLLAGQGEAAVGEGWCTLISGEASQAIRYFERNVDRAELGAAGRFSARLGLAESLLKDGKTRQAQFEFAKVSALDYGSRDRVAQAMVGLATCSISLGDSDAKANARRWLESTRDSFGDTPSAGRAAKLLETL